MEQMPSHILMMWTSIGERILEIVHLEKLSIVSIKIFLCLSFVARKIIHIMLYFRVVFFNYWKGILFFDKAKRKVRHQGKTIASKQGWHQTKTQTTASKQGWHQTKTPILYRLSNT